MAYTISKTNGQTLMSIGEAVSDNTYGITLIGQNFRDYGQVIANNFVRLLENAANGTQPGTPLTGQLWFDTSKLVLNYFDGERFRPMASYTANTSAPLKPLAGDQWWDTSSNTLNIFNGTGWEQITTAANTDAQIHTIVPKRAIILWEATTTIPSGWEICNGQNGTPNMIGLEPSSSFVYLTKMTG